MELHFDREALRTEERDVKPLVPQSIAEDVEDLGHFDIASHEYGLGRSDGSCYKFVRTDARKPQHVVDLRS